ncbi:MAG: hypothetical protein HLX51_11900 [Micrococcaceae bacterium]|nr:hypothetical protein [Micrococcaceae bacterium]
MSTSQKETLRDIARIAHDRHGVRGRGIERIADKGGYVMSRSTFDRMLKGEYPSRSMPQTLEALAYLADISLERVYEAADRRYDAKKFAEQLPPDIDQLTEDQRNAVISVARAFLNSNRENERLQNELEEVQQDDEPSNVVEADFAAEDVVPEQKIAAYDRDFGDGIGPGDLPEDS